jgi:sulfite exporter TauE/SafE/copper chaperone CopZ
MKKYTFFISGTHCSSCKILVEGNINELNIFLDAHVDLKNETVTMSTDSELSLNEILDLLNSKLQPNNYFVSTEKIVQEKLDENILWKAIPIGIMFLVLFFLLQKSGLLNIGINGKLNPLTGFFIGLIASVSSCLAIVGGLILSLSAKISQDTLDDKKNIILFHVGRIISFTLLGGVLGLLGGAIGINFTISSLLGILAAIVMIMLGVNLMGIITTNKVTLPSGVFKFFKKIEHKTLTPLIIGFGTFFLPCGFTQSMQVMALSSGSFITGALIMLAFVLGTFPVLALLSFGSASISHSKYAPLFFKVVGVVVTGLGIFAILGGFAGLGIIKPLFNI